jgi:hypothetical protein
MRPHPRIRKTVKWGATLTSVLLIAGWIASAWLRMTLWSQGGDCLELGAGIVAVARDSFVVPPDMVGLSARRSTWTFTWWEWAAERTSPHDWMLEAPIWALVVPPLLISATAWRLDTLARRRARVGLCPKCGYSLAGLPPTSLCPECGNVVAPSRAGPAS